MPEPVQLDARLVLEAAPVALVLIGADDTVLFANARTEQCFGWPPAELVGRPITTMLREAPRLDGERVVAGRHRDGRELAIELSLARPSPAYLVVTMRDVTDRQEAESKMMIADRLASVGTLAAGVAHEINNPLASLMGNLELSLRMLGAEPEEIVEQLRDAAQAAERVREIVRDLKVLARAEDEQLVPVDIDRIVGATLRVAAHTIKARARTRVQLGRVPPVLANEARLGQVVLNLVLNAAQAIPEGTPDANLVAVTTSVDSAGRVVIVVADTGVGIPAEIRGRMFDPFFTTKPVGVGTGLGLPICHKIVGELGGELRFTSEVGRGSEFRVILPVAGAVSERTNPVRPPQDASARRARILVIDDEPLIQRTIKRILVEHEVVTVDGAAAALASIRGGARYDLILCDLMMPEMSGMDLHDELSRIAPDQLSRVVYMTGGAFTPRARDFLAAVVNPRIDKPFDAGSLRTTVNGMLARAPMA